MAGYKRFSNLCRDAELLVVRRLRQGALLGLVLLGFCGIVSETVSAKGNNQQSSRSVKEILTDSQLWGRDFPTALASISKWSGFEQKIAIFPSHVLGTTPYRTSPEAARVEGLLNGLLPASGRVKASVVRWFEDDSFRVSVNDGAMQLLPQNLSMDTVRRRLGTPESITTIVITGTSERRPMVLKLYSYAGGAVVYAESVSSHTPGMVDRVFLDVNAVTQALQ